MNELCSALSAASEASAESALAGLGLAPRLLLAHGGHPDLGMLHALWHAAPWLLALGVGGYLITRWARTRVRR